MFWRAGMQAQDILLGGIHPDVPPKQPVCKLRGAHSSPKQHTTSLFASFACFLPCMVVLFSFTSHAHARLFRLWSPTVKRAFTFSTASQHDRGIVVGHELLLSNPSFFCTFNSISLNLLPSMVMVGTHRARVSLWGGHFVALYWIQISFPLIDMHSGGLHMPCHVYPC